VKNLYPSIPIDEALKLIEKLLRESKTLGMDHLIFDGGGWVDF
jgi:hypothetical protein